MFISDEIKKIIIDIARNVFMARSTSEQVLKELQSRHVFETLTRSVYYEYKAEEVSMESYNFDVEKLQKLLTTFGNEGWDLVFIDAEYSNKAIEGKFSGTPPLPRYEYMQFESTDDPDSDVEMLNDFGKEGWSVSSFYPNKGFFLLQRPTLDPLIVKHKPWVKDGLLWSEGQEITREIYGNLILLFKRPMKGEALVRQLCDDEERNYESSSLASAAPVK